MKRIISAALAVWPSLALAQVSASPSQPTVQPAIVPSSQDLGAAFSSVLREIYSHPNNDALMFAAELADTRASLAATNSLLTKLRADLAEREKEIADLKAKQ